MSTADTVPEHVPDLMTPELLLVDDNAIQAATRQAILSRTGVRVIVAEDARAALEVVAKPDINRGLRLVVTDHLMPGMNGPELVVGIRAILPNIPILVLSGLPGAEIEYETLGVSFHLKPFPPEDLIRIAKSLMAGQVLRSA